MLKSIFLPVLVLFLSHASYAADDIMPSSCQTDAKLQGLRSKELQSLYQGDQDDRKEIEAHLDRKWPMKMMQKMAKNDANRRRRVADIFAEGCINSAADYAAAAMVYQHGIAPDHFFQTFLWSKRAVELGDPTQKHLMALGIDRYLMNINQKQLFGSQAKKLNNDDTCWCLWPVEPTFPSAKRAEYLGQSVDQKMSWLKDINGKNQCPVAECKVDAKPTLSGFVPGFW